MRFIGRLRSYVVPREPGPKRARVLALGWERPDRVLDSVVGYFEAATFEVFPGVITLLRQVTGRPLRRALWRNPWQRLPQPGSHPLQDRFSHRAAFPAAGSLFPCVPVSSETICVYN